MGKNRRLDFDPNDPEKLVVSEVIPNVRDVYNNNISTALELGEANEI